VLPVSSERQWFFYGVSNIKVRKLTGNKKQQSNWGSFFLFSYQS
jgi:hypothetical protein